VTDLQGEPASMQEALRVDSALGSNHRADGEKNGLVSHHEYSSLGLIPLKALKAIANGSRCRFPPSSA
jgi:hypothetical protein